MKSLFPFLYTYHSIASFGEIEGDLPYILGLMIFVLTLASMLLG